MYTRELVEELGTILLKVYKYSEVGKQTFYKVSKSQIRKFLRYARPQTANPQILLMIRKVNIRKFLQNIAQLCLKTVLKVVFLLDFLLYTSFNCIIRDICKEKSMYFRSGGSPQITKNWVRKSQIRKGSHLQKVRKSTKLFKFADLRFAEIIRGPPTFLNTHCQNEEI